MRREVVVVAQVSDEARFDERRRETEGSGACSSFAECEAVCPKEMSIDFIARMNRHFLEPKAKGETKTPPST